MNDCSLADFIRDYFDWRLAGNYEAQEAISADDLATDLERQGYCSNPYIDFDKALTCAINKNREKYCGNINCTGYDFCMRLRKEGYV